MRKTCDNCFRGFHGRCNGRRGCACSVCGSGDTTKALKGQRSKPTLETMTYTHGGRQHPTYMKRKKGKVGAEGKKGKKREKEASKTGARRGRPPTLTEAQVTQAAEFRRAGHQWGDIGRFFGVTRHCVRKAVVRSGEDYQPRMRQET